MAGVFLVKIKEPTPIFRSACQHFGGGVLMGAVAVELLPDITHAVHQVNNIFQCFGYCFC